jgi:hypothetical protein
MNVRDELGRLTMFYLVESRVGPTDRPGFKYKLTKNETFESEFIVASKLDCQRLALEQQRQNNLVEQDFIAIADARSARDNTLLLQYYSHKDHPLEFPRYGILPRESQEHDAWIDFRIDYSRCNEAHASLTFVAPDVSYPVYFGRKEELR